MRQQTLADEGFERYRKRTRREQFLDEMDKIVPWKGLCEVIEPFYPKPEGAGRPPDRPATHAPDSFSAALVQPVRPGGGRGVV